jgi:hypothetical protein
MVIQVLDKDQRKEKAQNKNQGREKLVNQMIPLKEIK